MRDQVNQVFRLSRVPRPQLVSCFKLESEVMENAPEPVIPNEFSCSNPKKLFDAELLFIQRFAEIQISSATSDVSSFHSIF